MSEQVITDNGGYTAAVAGAVRAELARHKKRPAEIAAVLGLSRTTAYRRINGVDPFDVAELEQIAKWLGIPVNVIFDSARTAMKAVA